MLLLLFIAVVNAKLRLEDAPFSAHQLIREHYDDEHIYDSMDTDSSNTQTKPRRSKYEHTVDLIPPIAAQLYHDTVLKMNSMFSPSSVRPLMVRIDGKSRRSKYDRLLDKPLSFRQKTLRYLYDALEPIIMKTYSDIKLHPITKSVAYVTNVKQRAFDYKMHVAEHVLNTWLDGTWHNFDERATKQYDEFISHFGTDPHSTLITAKKTNWVQDAINFVKEQSTKVVQVIQAAITHITSRLCAAIRSSFTKVIIFGYNEAKRITASNEGLEYEPYEYIKGKTRKRAFYDLYLDPEIEHKMIGLLKQCWRCTIYEVAITTVNLGYKISMQLLDKQINEEFETWIAEDTEENASILRKFAGWIKRMTHLFYLQIIEIAKTVVKVVLNQVKKAMAAGLALPYDKNKFDLAMIEYDDYLEDDY